MIFSNMLSSEETLHDRSKNLVNKISESSHRMSLLIKDLLQFSRLLNSETMLRPVDLSAVMASVTGDFELIIHEKNAAVTIGKLPVIEAVGLQMNQLFYNLLGNALKFSRPGIEPEITIDVQAITEEDAYQHVQKIIPGSNYYHITFADNGIGFEVKYSEQIFEIFKRLHGRSIYPGSGIGLALCRRIVANHNGALYAESEPDKGSVFHIIIPGRQHPDEVFETDTINKI